MGAGASTGASPQTAGGGLVARQEFAHPTLASRVRLNVYAYQPDRAVAGMPAEAGYLLTEDRVGTVTVVSTRGFFPARDEAVAALQARARELEAQRFRPSTSAA
jgi:hypothetical protein